MHRTHGGRYSIRVGLCATIAFLALPGASSPAGEQPLENATKELLGLVTSLADVPPGQADVQKRLREAFTEFETSTTKVRTWLAEHESAAAVYAKEDSVTPNWGVEHDYADAWNDLLTLARHHGVAPPKERHLVRERKPAFWNLVAAYPVSRRWRIEWPDEDQKSAVLTQKNASGKAIRTVIFYRYRWNTTYSGIGGENAQKLAEVLWKLEREVYAERARDASRSVEIRAFNKNVARSYYYFVRGPDPDDQREKRTRNWYFKGKRNTFCVQVIDELDASLATTELDRALQAEADAEIALVIDSISMAER